MAGLLGDSMDDPRTAGMLALAGGMINGGLGSGLLGFNQAYQGAQNGLLERQNLAQQIQLRGIQAAQAQRQFEWTNNMLGDLSSPPPAQGTATGPATSPTPGGPLGSGTYGISTGGQQPVTPTNAPATGGSLIQQARAMGIPDMAIKSDLALNGGKGIADMIYKRGTPNMEFVGNVAVDKNQIGPGFSVPTVSMSGQASQTVPDPTAPGGFRVIAPPGALDTYRAYKQEDAGIAASHDVQKVWNPQKGAYEYVTKAQVLNATQQPPVQPPASGPAMFPTQGSMAGQGSVDMGPNPVSLANEIAQTQASIPLAKDPASKAMLTQYLATLKQQQAALPHGPMQAEPSAVEAARNAGLTAGATTTATSSASMGTDYQKNLDSKVEEEFQLVNRNKQIMPLLAQFKTGGMGAEQRLHIGNAIANMDSLPASIKGPLSTWIANGDPTAGKVIENQLASAGILNMLQTLDKEGKPNRAIFQAVQKAQEGLNSGNTTLQDVFELQKRLYDIHYNEQQALTKAIKTGTYDPRTWSGDYSSVRNAGLNTPAIPLPSASASGSSGTATPGSASGTGAGFVDSLPKTAPKGARARDTQTGDILTFNGLSWVKGK